MRVHDDDKDSERRIWREPHRRDATSPRACASIAYREHVLLAVRGDEDGGSGLQHLVWVLRGGQSFEHAVRSVVGEHTTWVGVFRSPLGGDKERVACACRKPERKQRQRQAYPMVVAGGYELGSLVVRGPEPPAGECHGEAVSGRQPAAADDAQLSTGASHDDLTGTIGGHRRRTLRDWIRCELAPGGRLELHQSVAGEQAHEQPSLMKQKTKRRPADVLRPGHAEAGEAHGINVAWGAVRDVRHVAVVRNDDRHRVLANRDRTLLCPVL